MNIDASGPRLILDTVATSAQNTPVESLLAQADDFKKQGDKQALELHNLSDQVLFRRETQDLYQKITDTINFLSAKGIPYSKIQQQVSMTLNLYRGQLTSSFNQFKENEARFNADSSRFNPAAARAARTTAAANGGSSTFAPPQVSFTDRMKQRKIALAQCVQRNMDPEAPGTTLDCLVQHSKGLPKEEQQELAAELLPISLGGVASAVAIPFAAASKVMKAGTQALGTGIVINGCLKADPFSFGKCVAQAEDLLAGRDQKANAAIVEAMPPLLLKVGEELAHIDTNLRGFDAYMVMNCYTPEGLMHEAGLGMSDIVVGKLMSSATRATKELALGAARFVESAAKTQTVAVALVNARQQVVAFARSETGSVKLPISSEELAIRIKEYMRTVKLPLSQKELDTLIRKEGFREVPGGKGGHKKFQKETPEKDTIIRPSGEVASGTQREIVKKIARSKVLESLLSESEAPIKNPNLKIGFHNRPLPHRLDYSRDYFHAGKEFTDVKEFNGVFSRDLLVVQYHSAAPLGELHTYKWFMPIPKGVEHGSIESLMTAVSKMHHVGDITHVSIAKIPAGEPVRFLHGRAISKLDPDTNVIRPGGALQYRFFDFDADQWIVATLKLP